MTSDLVLTLIGPDRPGLVEEVASVVSGEGGNWLESRMAHLAGKFAGILRVEVPTTQRDRLEKALAALESKGLRIVVGASAESPAGEPRQTMNLELVGLDRPGLVREVSRLLASQAINVEELSTDRSSAPMSAEPIFRAVARVNVPAGVNVVELRQSLERLAGDLMVEIQLAPGAAG